MAQLIHFLIGKTLFSSMSPDAEINLKEELYACFKFIGISLEELNRMPVRDRKFYIVKHNEYTERQNEAYENRDK